MNEFMHFAPFFALCEDFLTTFTTFIQSYGLTITCCLLWVAATLLVVDSGLALFRHMTGAWRAHKKNLFPYYADIKYEKALDKAAQQEDVYRNCPIRLTEIALQVEMAFGANLNWEYANEGLLVGSRKAKKKARKALLGADWLAFVTAVPAAERTQLYKSAMGLKKAFDKLEADKKMEHQALVEPLGFTVTAIRWNHKSQSWSFSYACKVTKRKRQRQGDTDGDVNQFTVDQWGAMDLQKRAYHIAKM